MPLNIDDPNASDLPPSDPKPRSAAGLRINPAGNNPPPTTSAPAHRWTPTKLDPTLFPDRPTHGTIPPATITNVRHLLDKNGIEVRYKVIKKKLEIGIPGMPLTGDNSDNVAMTHIISLAALHGMHTGQVPSYVDAIGDANAYNPVADWITSKVWDGKDRLRDFYATLVQREGYPETLKCLLMYKWLLSTVAASLMKTGFHCRGVLTLQGGQGIGKTSWGQSLVPDPLLRDAVVKADHHLDGGNKDSMIGAITHWIVEIGELESSLKRDLSRLKGFLAADRDKVRRPYARGESEYPRRTVFYATVNAFDFLLDATGNTRWWTIEVDSVDYSHGIDMQQLFAQLAVDFAAGKQWWLTKDEETALEEQNDRHRTNSFVQDSVMDLLDVNAAGNDRRHAVTASELLVLAGIDRPTNPQTRECGALLRRLYGDPKRIHGRDKWRVPLLVGRDGPPASPGRPLKDKFD